MQEQMMEQDDRAQAELAAERHQITIAALWHAMMAVPEELFLHLCFECGIDRKDVEAYKYPLLQMPARRNHEVKYPNF